MADSYTDRNHFDTLILYSHTSLTLSRSIQSQLESSNKIHVHEAQLGLLQEIMKDNILLRSKILSSLQPKIGREFTINEIQIQTLKRTNTSLWSERRISRGHPTTATSACCTRKLQIQILEMENANTNIGNGKYKYKYWK